MVFPPLLFLDTKHLHLKIARFGKNRRIKTIPGPLRSCIVQVYCDMSAADGGWTLIASIHENNINDHCGRGDMWSSSSRGIRSGACCLTQKTTCIIQVVQLNRLINNREYFSFHAFNGAFAMQGSFISLCIQVLKCLIIFV